MTTKKRRRERKGDVNVLAFRLVQEATKEPESKRAPVKRRRTRKKRR